MYGLKQAALLAYNFQPRNLEPYGYHPIPHTLDLWKHVTRKIAFCLYDDEFGVKYFHKDDVDHLIATLKRF